MSKCNCPNPYLSEYKTRCLICGGSDPIIKEKPKTKKKVKKESKR